MVWSTHLIKPITNLIKPIFSKFGPPNSTDKSDFNETNSELKYMLKFHMNSDVE